MAHRWWKWLLYPAIFVAVAVAYRVYSETAGPRFDEGLKKLEADMKRQLPMKVDEITTLVDVKYQPTNTIYWYVMDTTDYTVDPHALEQNIHVALCSNAEALRTIKEKGFTYEYHYVNKERAFLAAFTITKCP
jgi:hypothetical protein